MVSISTRTAQAVLASAVLLGLLPLFWLVLRQSNGGLMIDASVFAVLWFTLKQAFLSTFISVGFGIFVARALARRDFFGRSIILKCFALPAAVPAIVAVLGLTALFGESGIFPKLFTLYGLAGIVLAHVFFNLPMATRFFYQGLQTIPSENFRLSAQLNFDEFATFKHLEWPVVRGLLPRVGALIFLICAASFVIVLTLGGTSSTTLEVAIYQSLRLDFDLQRALQLSLLQIALCLILVWGAMHAFLQSVATLPLRQGQQRFDRQSIWSKLINFAAIFGALVVVFPPLLVIIVQGLPNLHFNFATAQAMVTSFLIAAVSAIVAVLLAWPLAKANDRLSQTLSLASYIVPPAVLATGWFLLILHWNDSSVFTVVFIIGLNSFMALPFCAAALRVGFARLSVDHIKLAQQLGFTQWQKFLRVELPILRKPLAQAFLLGSVLSLGDLTAITLLGSHNITTLPSLLHIEMGHYRGQDAAGTALLLLIICAALTYFAEALHDKN
jgi:thiamine transport system permease protein